MSEHHHTEHGGASATTRGARARADLRAMVLRDPIFSSMDGAILDDLLRACEVLEAPSGLCLNRAGEPVEAVYGIVHGALRLVRSDDPASAAIREFYRGEVVGLLALFLSRPSPVDLFVVRDSLLLEWPRARVVELMERHPSLLLRLVGAMGERTFDVLEALVGKRALRASGGNVALLPLLPDPQVGETKRQILDGIFHTRAMRHLTARTVDRALGRGAADGGTDAERVTAWLSNFERAADVVLYECDPRRTGWTARCRRQSDRLLLVAAANGDPRAAADTLARTRPDGLSRPVDLVLVHPPGSSLPSGTRAWSSIEGVPGEGLRGIHHVRAGRRADIERVVRRLVGRPVGVALSGGGARGIAHIGVLTAIVEAGIPIDYIAGASMGAIFAGGFARGLSIPAMKRQVRDLFSSPFALYDLTVPISSILAGRKLDRVLQRALGDADIEDLWLPFFCVSTDLSRAELIVHDRGPLWRGVRASCSIPGIFPPLPSEGRTLVDGGVMDNLPIDLLAERCPGPLIAVDVLPYGDPTFNRPTSALARWARAVRSRIRGEQASPPLFDILMRSTLVGSKYRQQMALSHTEDVLYLDPPVAGFGMLQWGAFDALFEAGYRYAKEKLAEPGALLPGALLPGAP